MADLMRPDILAGALPFADALTALLTSVSPITRTEVVPLDAAVGRVAAETLRSSFDVPPFDRSAMDGFAVRSVDLAGAALQAPIALQCVARAAAGDVPSTPIGPGQCVEIATGAPMPMGADAVVMVERTSREGDRVLVADTVSAGQNIGRRGADIGAGEPAVAAGTCITPARAGALAAIGITHATVFARPRVSIFSSGSEVVAPGVPLAPGQIYDVNAVTLRGVVEGHGGEAVGRPRVPDSVDALADALSSATGDDIIVCSGGSSVGRRDLLTDALARCGRIVFHGIAVKPGKPTLFGYVGETPLFGMPGNPTSCLSNAYLLLVPFLRAAARLPPWRPTRVEAPLAARIVSNAGRHHFYTVRLVDGHVRPAFKSSGDITSMAHADGYIEISAETSTVEAGTIVTVTLF
jgi:molybdopterin molybdotransferase